MQPIVFDKMSRDTLTDLLLPPCDIWWYRPVPPTPKIVTYYLNDPVPYNWTLTPNVAAQLIFSDPLENFEELSFFS